MTKRITLGEVVKVDRTVATAQQSKELAYVGLEHIEKISGHFDPYYIAVSAELLATKFVFTPDHVLLGKLRPNLGKVVRPNFTGICSTDILPLLPKTGILDRTYLWGLLLTQKFTKWASNNVTGANLPRLDPKLLVEYSFDLPAFAEQKIIAARLTKADRIRRLRRAALDQSESFLQSVFLEMFGGEQSLDFDLAELGEISEVRGGLQLSSRREVLSYKAPYLRVANVYRNELNLSEIKMIGLTVAEFEKTKLQTDDLLIVEGHGNIAEIGRCAIWDGSVDGCVHQNHLIRVRTNNKQVQPEYLSWFINSKTGQNYFKDRSNTTSGLNTISTGIVSEMPVYIPSLVLQKRFAAIVHRHERIRVQQREGLRQAEYLFQSLLHQAFGQA